MAKYPIFFGTYSKGDGNGLFRGEFDDETGSLRLNDTIDIENPAYLYLEPSKNILYGVSEVNSFNGAKGGSVFSVSLADSEKMKLLSIEGTNGRSPCHLCVLDKFIFTANYTEGSLSIFDTDGDGFIAPSYLSFQHYGKGTNPNRQEQSHIHFATAAPCNVYLAICDLGLDKVFLYPYSAKKGISTNAKIIECPAGSGPRHLTFSANGEYLYVLTEMGNTVLAYKCSEENFEFLQEISTLPSDFKGVSNAAAIHISPDGKFLAASNRGHDSIAVFGIESDGKLQSPQYIMTDKEPRDFRYAPNGNWILSANQNDNCVTIYQINANGDGFKETGKISIPKPVCIVFGV